MTFKQPGPFVKHLMHLGFKRHRPVQAAGDFETYYLDLSDLKLRTSRFTPFVIPRQLSGRSLVEPSELADVADAFGDSPRSVRDDFAVLLVGGSFDHQCLRTNDLGGRGIVLLGRDDMQAIEDAPSKEIAFERLGLCLRRYLGLRALSPYILSRPAIAGRFFGRHETVNPIVAGKDGANYTFIGNRRIGKTSVLREIKDRLSVRNKQSETICFADVYGANCESAVDVVQTILSQLDLPAAAAHLQNDPTRLKHFPAQLREIPERRNMEVAVFVDEVDYILALDEQTVPPFQLLNLLRSAFEHTACRIFFAGFRRAIAASNSLDHPLHNFTRVKILRRLGREDTDQMVTVPMTRMGIAVENTDLPATIYRETGGHPELVQMMCDKVVDIVDCTGKVPEGGDLLTKLYEDDFERRIFQTFIANTDAYERLLCYLLVRRAYGTREPEKFEFTEQSAHALIRSERVGVDSTVLSNMLRNLEVSSITMKLPGTNRWKFAVPQLVRYCANSDLTAQIAIAREDAANTPKESILDWPREGKLG